MPANALGRQIHQHHWSRIQCLTSPGNAYTWISLDHTQAEKPCWLSLMHTQNFQKWKSWRPQKQSPNGWNEYSQHMVYQSKYAATMVHHLKQGNSKNTWKNAELSIEQWHHYGLKPTVRQSPSWNLLTKQSKQHVLKVWTGRKRFTISCYLIVLHRTAVQA